MFGFSKKRFFVTLGLSILIWIGTAFIQVFDTEEWNFLLLGGTSCSATGFPIRECISSGNNGLLISIGLVNLTFWFLIINLLFLFKKISVAILSLLVWGTTIVMQRALAFPKCFDNPGWYRLTGYPVTDCISRDEKHVIFSIYLVNIAFWFIVLSLIRILFSRLKLISF